MNLTERGGEPTQIAYEPLTFEIIMLSQTDVICNGSCTKEGKDIQLPIVSIDDLEDY